MHWKKSETPMSDALSSPDVGCDDIFVLERLGLIWGVEQQQESRQENLVLLRQVSRVLIRVKWWDVSSVDDGIHQVTQLFWNKTLWLQAAGLISILKRFLCYSSLVKYQEIPADDDSILPWTLSTVSWNPWDEAAWPDLNSTHRLLLWPDKMTGC